MNDITVAFQASVYTRRLLQEYYLPTSWNIYCACLLSLDRAVPRDLDHGYQMGVRSTADRTVQSELFNDRPSWRLTTGYSLSPRLKSTGMTNNASFKQFVTGQVPPI